MGKAKVYSTTEIAQKPSLLYTDIPFDVTKSGQVVAQVVRPGGIWRECQNCGENTKNIIEFQDEHFEWHKLILCDKCSDGLL
jgi:hypothetical protein